MYPDDDEVSSRVNAIATKIVEVDKDPWVFLEDLDKQKIELSPRSRGKAFNSYHNSLDLAFLLLDEKCFFSQVFWKSYALTYQVSNNLFVDDLDLKDINKINSFILTGGVASNLFIRRKFKLLCKKRGLSFIAPEKKLCTDNATMIAWAGHEILNRRKKSSNFSLSPKPRWRLDSL